MALDCWNYDTKAVNGVRNLFPATLPEAIPLNSLKPLFDKLTRQRHKEKNRAGPFPLQQPLQVIAPLKRITEHLQKSSIYQFLEAYWKQKSDNFRLSTVV